MQPVLRRIAIHGGLTALALALIGLMFANMASMWMAASQSSRATVRYGQDDAAKLSRRVPVMMALWGFGFVAIGELVLYRFRRNRKPTPPVPAPSPDPAEMLLEELLAQAEASAGSPPSGQPAPPIEGAEKKTAAPGST